MTETGPEKPTDTGPKADDVFWDRWDEVDPIFAAALDVAPGERDRFLVEACHGDVELLRVLRGLLATADRAEPRLERPPPILLRDVWDVDTRAASIQPGQTVGRYRIVRELGRGGMAAVYEAERADGEFEQRVAIKLLRRGIDTKEVVRRFLAERQILSGLEHPNIARLIDGGTTDDGRPFLVMECVKGEPITDWADRRRLTVRGRLRLFLQAADAVQFAHRRLVIHRDIKPSNILVDETGTVKLLDFGIAKLLDLTADDDFEAITRTSARPLFTPAFASPEQVRAQRVTTASDVYQLGALLYLLLAGRRPFQGDGAELQVAITTGRLRRPSEATATDVATSAPAASSAPAGREVPQSAAAIATARRTTPDGLRRTLRGDLDAIILAALRTEPERRYPSAADMAEDVARYLARKPVLARPDTLAYRGKRFASRHPALVAAMCGAVLVAAGYMITLERHAAQVETERDIARTESAKAEQVSNFLMDLFRSNDPDRTAGEPPDAFELLERGVERADALSDQPAIRAEMLDVIAQMYTLLGHYDRAEPLFRAALEQQRALHAEPHSDVAAILDQLGDVLQRLGRYDEAEPILLDAIEVARLAGDSALLADSFTDLGHSLIKRGDYIGAEQAYRDALAIRLDLFGERHERTAIAWHNLALVLEEQERFPEAESLYVKAIEIEREVMGSDHTQTALTLTTLARLYLTQRRLDEAEPLLREALESTRQRLGPRHERVGLILNELGMVAARRHQWADAQRYFGEALEINEASFGPNHDQVAVALNNIAYAMMEQDQLEDALPLRRRVLEIARATIGDGHENTGVYAHNLGFLLDRLGRDTEAEATYREALRILEGALPDGHVLATRPLTGLGDLLARTDRAAEAEPLLREALARRIAAQEMPAAIAEVESMLGGCLAQLGRAGEAGPLLERSLAALEQAVGPDARLTREARARLDGFRARNPR
jgi:serine/threonine-protein kinase